jgi:glyceraldehyde 3-phosphate dehydrogenase
MIRLGINGFGRMGRLAFRAAWGSADVAVVHINEIKGGAATAAHLLEFDSVHGRWSKPMKASADELTVEGRSIRFSAESKPNDVPWEASSVDIVLELFRETADR